MTASIGTDILAIIALCFTIYLAKRNILINNCKTFVYISAAITTIVLLLLEIATIVMQLSNNNNLAVPHRIANVIGFILSPVVPYILLFFNNRTGKRYLHSGFLALPQYFNAFMCIASYKTGWIFYVDVHNQYTRGNLFLIPTIISVYYFVLIAITAVQNSIEYDNDDKEVLIPIILLPLLGIIVQILFKDVLLIWGSVSVSLLLYYIFLRELYFKYDVQTEMRNRSAFEKEMSQHLKSNRDVAIVVIDINNLKNINDGYGHQAGDETIYHAAKIIHESFKGVGKAYRIGGDEFCIICQGSSSELIDSTLSNMECLLTTENQKHNIDIALAYGYALYYRNSNEDVYSTFAKADEVMYIHKAKLKNTHVIKAR